MAVKNIQMTQRNAANTGWDDLNPKTLASIVSTAGGSTVEDTLVQYAVATGTANTYAISAPAITALVAGMAVCVKINIASSGTSTLNWNGKGAKTIKKANGVNVTNLAAGGLYTLRYDGTNFILQGEGGSGNAIAADLLSGKTASTDAGDIVGTMANNSGAFVGTTYNASAGVGIDIAVPAGYYPGGQKNLQISDANFIASNLCAGKTYFGLAGAYNKIYGSGDKLLYSQVGLPAPPSKTILQHSSYNNCSLRGIVGAGGITVKFYNDYVKGYNEAGTEIWSTQVGYSTGSVISADVTGDYVYVATSQNGYTTGVSKIRISTGARIWFVSYPSGGFTHTIISMSVSPADGYVYILKDYYNGSSWYYNLLILNTSTGATINTYSPSIVNDGGQQYKRIIAIDENYFMIVNPYQGAGDMSLFARTAPTTPIWTAQVGSIMTSPYNIVNVGTSWFMYFGNKLWRSVANGIMTFIASVAGTSNNTSYITRSNDNKLIIPTATLGINKIVDTNGGDGGTIILHSATAQVLGIGRNNSANDDTLYLDVLENTGNTRYNFIISIMNVTIQ